MEKHFYEFGPYRIDTVERRLLRGNKPVPLTPKAYQTLLVLVENAGHGLDKDELLRRVWPDTFVGEVSLARNISVLRKVLGDGDAEYIETIPKRGYRFVASVTQSHVPPESLTVDEHTLTHVFVEETATSTGPVLSFNSLVGAVIVVLVLVGVTYFAVTSRPRSTVKSLAVLPLKDLSGRSDQKYLELGIADSIIVRVSDISGLTVRPLGAVRRYAEASIDPLQAARELKVEAVLDSTMQAVDGRIRANFNLLQVSTGTSLWTQSFEVRDADILNLEEEVARQVAGQLRKHLDTSGQARAWRQSTANPEAYEHYLKGLYSDEVQRVTGGTRASLETAITRFKKATELDPSYAQAWARLAMSYGDLLRFYEADQNLEQQANEAARRAYALAPDIPELHLYRSQAFWSWNGGYQVEQAIRELRRAAGYNSSDVHSRLGAIYFHAGLERQAITELKRAIEIDPANALHRDRLAQAYVWAGRYDEARSAYERAFAIESESRGSIAISAVPLLYAGRFDEARRRLESGRARDPRNVVAPAYLALLAALQGRHREAESVISSAASDMEKLLEAHHAFYAYASVCALQGKSTEAVRWLRKTVATGMPDYPMFARDPNLDRIRNSLEFAQFMGELKPRWDAMDREFR